MTQYSRMASAKLRGIVGILVAGALVAGACGGDDVAGDDPEPPTTTSSATSSTTASTGSTSTVPPSTTAEAPEPVCAEPLEGNVPAETAVRADLDGDGVADQLLVTDTADDRYLQAVLSGDGRTTEPLIVTGFTWWPHDIQDAADLDRDGADELFVSIGGNTALSGVIVQLDGCGLRTLEGTESYNEGEPFWYLYFAGGNSCAPSGCFVSVTCADGGLGTELIQTEVVPAVNALDPDFDWEAHEAIPEADRPMRVHQRRFLVTDGRVEPLATIESDMTFADTEPWRRRMEVVCSASLAGDGCGLEPNLPVSAYEIDGWSFEWLPGESVVRSQEFDIPMRVWRWTRDSDGAVVELQNPGSWPVGDGDAGTATVLDGEAGIASTAHGWRPWFLMWATGDGYPRVACEGWSLVTNDLHGVEFMEFAAAAVGAADVEWFYGMPEPQPNAERLLEIGNGFRDELLDFAWNAGPPPTIALAAEIRRYVGAVPSTPIESTDAEAADDWIFWPPTEVNVNVLAAFSAIREWEVVIGPSDRCEGEPRRLPQSVRFLHQIALIGHDPSTPGCDGWIALELFVSDFEILQGIRLDTGG